MSSTKIKQVIVPCVRYPDGNGGMRKVRTGKLVAWGAHVSMAFLSKRVTESCNPQFSEVEQTWLHGKFTKICVSVESEEDLLTTFQQAKEAGLVAHLIQDAGDTEFGGVPTYTACGIGPDEAAKIDAITGNLPLL
jgi:peptidyl-tRNA hydrolase, PTH2 family